MMLRIELSKVASRIFKRSLSEHQKQYNEIWEVLKANGLHAKTKILHQFTPETQSIIQSTLLVLDAENRALNNKLKKQP
jgi:hypothetical protein